MSDRDSLLELFSIVFNIAKDRDLSLTGDALSYIENEIGKGCDVFLRRRLSVCRMLTDMHLPGGDNFLDILIATTLCNYLPGDRIPDDYSETLDRIFSVESKVSEILRVLTQKNYEDKSYYEKIIDDEYALIIRLTERAVLLESLYEWSSSDARRYISDTRDNFLPLCIKAKEKYPSLLAPLNIIMEKTKNLLLANETLLNRYEQKENYLRLEILTIQEENAAIKSMIREYENIGD